MRTLLAGLILLSSFATAGLLVAPVASACAPDDPSPCGPNCIVGSVCIPRPPCGRPFHCPMGSGGEGVILPPVIVERCVSSFPIPGFGVVACARLDSGACIVEADVYRNGPVDNHCVGLA